MIDLPKERSIWRNIKTKMEVKVEGVGVWEPDHNTVVICYRAMGGGRLLVQFLSIWTKDFEEVNGTRPLTPDEQ